jgi:predicted metal-binding protein
MVAVLEDIITYLREIGVTDVKPINAADIVVDERVRLKCQVPRCDSYGQNLMCPPHVPSVAEFRTQLSLFSNALLIKLSADIGDTFPDVYATANRLHDLVNRGEKAAFDEGFRFATGLIGGCCRLCEECIIAEGSTKCRFPFKARPSMEAMGIDVIATSEKAGWGVTFPVNNEVTWIGLILIE